MLRVEQLVPERARLLPPVEPFVKDDEASLVVVQSAQVVRQRRRLHAHAQHVGEQQQVRFPAVERPFRFRHRSLPCALDSKGEKASESKRFLRKPLFRNMFRRASGNVFFSDSEQFRAVKDSLTAQSPPASDSRGASGATAWPALALTASITSSAMYPMEFPPLTALTMPSDSRLARAPRVAV